ncbi:hypothetical protein A0H81_14394 [Grifola frondosa]|uniref:DUF6699 domain-containing protein n=1 Tax=Grifola frondosa TaxID=5627 RepID=A0A1C7LRV4_GRIFR|nr:hypothetical protein A0H81_14394 [Grifola frondosa]
MPPPRSVQVWLDPILARPEGSAFPPLIWDLMVHPNNIRLGSATGFSRAQVLSKPDLERYAAAYVDNGAHVPLRTITLRLHQLPRDIEIVPTTLPYVTVRDVLYELYRTLRISVERGEYRDLPRREREALQDAFRARLARVVDPFARAEDERYGIRRIDFLGDRRVFLGLLPAVGHDIPYGKRAGEAFMVDVVRAL